MLLSDGSLHSEFKEEVVERRNFKMVNLYFATVFPRTLDIGMGHLMKGIG